MSYLRRFLAAVFDFTIGPILALVLIFEELGVVAKIRGTAAVARLFALTQPALMQLPWFANLYGRWKPWKNALIARVKATLMWRRTANKLRAIQQWVGW